jgi:hypothetical protein
MRIRTTLLAGLLVVASTVAGWAQAPTTRVRGTIEKVDGATLTVKARDGSALTIKLADNATVGAVVPAKLSDIKPGDYVGVAATPQAGGMLRAVEVHIFPEAMRGTGEGHRPWDLLPESTMTNATVADTVTQVEGPILVLKYKEGQQRVFVPADAPVVTYVAGDRSELKPGAKIFVGAASRQPDGSLQASRINVGRGIEPPM